MQAKANSKWFQQRAFRSVTVLRDSKTGVLIHMMGLCQNNMSGFELWADVTHCAHL